MADLQGQKLSFMTIHTLQCYQKSKVRDDLILLVFRLIQGQLWELAKVQYQSGYR